MGRRDERPPVPRALEAATGLKPGSWESVEALALLAIEAGGRPENGIVARGRPHRRGRAEVGRLGERPGAGLPGSRGPGARRLRAEALLRS